jgi:outer membrane receptor protein involved in Fe transport
VPSAPSEYTIESESIALRTEWQETLSSQVDARLGSDVRVQPFQVNVPGTDAFSGPAGSNVLGSNAGDFTQIDVDGGLYGELDWRLTPRVDLRPGLRLDAFTSRSVAGKPLLGGDSGSGRAAGAVDPRLSARWDVTSWLAGIAALGVAHQASNIPLPSPGLQFSQLARGLQSSFQYSAGAEVQLPLKFTATLDAFLHDYTGIADLYESCPAGEASCTFAGRAVGMELLIRRRLTERLTGWLSYTLSDSERDAFFQGRWIRRPSEFDRPHVVNLVLAADLGKRWRAGARLMAYSGLPYSTFTGIEGPPNAREPPFVRLDLRLEKKWQALGGTLSLVFEWLNALLSKESFGTQCPGIGQCQPETIGPITFPSVGVEEVW